MQEDENNFNTEPQVSDNERDPFQIDQFEKESLYAKVKRFIKQHKPLDVFVVVVVLLVAIISTFFYFRDDVSGVPTPSYSQAYQFVNEKISKNAAIALNLPAGVGAAMAQKNISFNPEIKGTWVSNESSDTLIFKPKVALEVGQYYTALLDTETMRMQGDFLVDEDPQIDAVFPKKDSEANEYSSITFVFNRPMVPLTTLEILEKSDIPIEIIPKTEGRFKWISTRNLQFIPEERLQRSSNYIVKVGEGLLSVDGLPISPTIHTFKTRPIRYENVHSGKTLYNQPIRLVFNQPVDLEKTIAGIKLTGSTNRNTIPFIAEYGTREIYNKKKKEYEEFTDRAIIEIHNKEDRHGRNGLWDFSSSYQLQIGTVYPIEGDIVLTQRRSTSIQVPEIIESLRAVSDRSNFAEPKFFDPEGKIIVRFFEEVDVRRSTIQAKGLKDASYDERCKEDDDGRTIYSEKGECEKEDDRMTLVLTFDPNVLKERSEQVSITFEKIYNTEGFKINANPLVKTITTYPKLTVLSTSPTEGAGSASLTELVVCTNTPLKPRSKDEYEEAFSVSGGYFVFSRWSNPRLIKRPSSYNKCSVGQFENRIRYGLHPETNYTFSLTFEDDFNQKTTKALTFTTATPDSRDLRFQNLQKIYNVTSPGKTRLTYSTENFEYVDIHICKLSATALLGKLANRSSLTATPTSAECESVKQDRIELTDRYWVNYYFQINVEDYFPNTLGHYVVTFSHPNFLTYRKERRYDRTYLSVTRLAVGEKRLKWQERSYSYGDAAAAKDRGYDDLTDPGENIYWVSKFNTLEPVVGALITLYKQKGYDGPLGFAATYVTDEEGIAKGKVVQDARGAVVSFAGDSTIISDWTDILQSARSAEEIAKTYIYTDRPIYRPGHEVFIKGLDRIGYDGSYQIIREKDAKIIVTDSRKNVIFEQDVPVSEYGTFNASFKLPTDASLGIYFISAFGATSFFDVEEYVPAAFKLELESNQDEFIAGETMKIDVNAEYFFGVPLSGGEVQYSVTSQDYNFDKYKDEYFNFGGGWYSCYSCNYGDDFLFRDNVTLDSKGTAVIEKSLDFKEFFTDAEDEGSKIFIVQATVKDSNGRSVSAQKSFIVHRGELYLGVKTNRSFFHKNNVFTLRAKSVDTEGKAVSKRNINLEIKRIVWKTFKRREVDGGFYYKSEKEETIIKKETIRTDKNGDYKDDFMLAEEGRYEITLSTTDSLDNTINASTRVYVYGEGQVSVRQTNNATLEIETETLDVNVGDKPKILIKSPYTKAKALITVERGKVFTYDVVDINRSLFDYAVTITKEHIPNVFVSVLLLSGDPEVKFGQVRFSVDKEQQELTVEVKANKAYYLPGEKVELDVTTTNYLGKPVRAEVSIAVADLSVLALKGNPKKNPLVFFYDGFPLTVTTASNIKNILHELDIPLGTKGGGGAGAPDDLAKRKRGVFRDTAFWEAQVVTDKNGKAHVSFTLPDNLTTWQIESVGITKDTLLGTDYSEFLSKKELMVIPLKPRFIIPGDEFFIGAKVFNQTEKKQKLTVFYGSESLLITDDTSNKPVSIERGETKTIYFKVSAPKDQDSGRHIFTLSAKNDQFEDTVEQSISITPNDTYEVVATAHFTKEDSAREYVYVPDSVLSDKGGLTINTNATMAVFLSDALNYLVSYPYGCSEQLASKLSSLAIVQEGLNLKNIGNVFKLDDIVFEGETYSIDEVVRLGLARVYEAQTGGGGFSYYNGMNPNFYLTLHVVQALENLREAGFSINESSLNRASQYLYQKITTDTQLNRSASLVILTAYVLGDVDSFSLKNKNVLKSKIEDIAGREALINEEISSLSLAYLAIITEEGYSQSIKNKIFETLENRIAIDGRGAYLKSNQKKRLWQYYETPIKNTALLLSALTVHENEHPLTDKIIRWLLRSRSKDGAWGSTNNTLAVIDAFTDYLEWQRETESDFTLKVTLDETELGNFDFNPDTVLETMSTFVPIGDFEQNTIQTLSFNRTNRNELQNNFYYDMSLKYYLPIEEVPPRDEGITIEREFYTLDDEDGTTPVRSAVLGDVLRGRLTITIPKVYNFVSVEDIIPAGFEIVNFNLATEDSTLQNRGRGAIKTKTLSGTQEKPSMLSSMLQDMGTVIGNNFKFQSNTSQTAAVLRSIDEQFYLDERKKVYTQLRTDFEELHDDRIFLFTERVNPGVYIYDYYIRALVPGTFHHLPAIASEMYFPEVFGRTSGSFFTIKEK